MATLRNLWANDARIEHVTFRMLISMTSGIKDYYYDRTNWLFFQWYGGTRTVEPLEYLAHMDKGFLFDPGSNTTAPGSTTSVARGSYSTNGFSLVGLALCGLLNLTSWEELDQRQLAWGAQLPSDDATLFPTTGTCSSYKQMARQYNSLSPNASFTDVTGHACLNSWLGGNLAARPRDVARFTHAVYNGLLSNASINEMTRLHPLTDGFAAWQLAYGLGLEAMWVDGTAMPYQTCSAGPTFGHGGLDYGSGMPIGAWAPELKLGVSMAITASLSYGSTNTGMNCSRPWDTLPSVNQLAMGEALNAVAVYAGRTPSCPSKSYTPQPPASCVDASSFGKIDGFPQTCATFLPKMARASYNSISSICDEWLSTKTLSQLKGDFAHGKPPTLYTPPPGFDPNTTLGVELCKGTCMEASAGPCWLNKPTKSWCNDLPSRLPARIQAAEAKHLRPHEYRHHAASIASFAPAMKFGALGDALAGR